MTFEHDERPWGEYTVLDESTGYKVKRITVGAAKRISYQRHARREEHWIVVHGAGRVSWMAKNSTSCPEQPYACLWERPTVSPTPEQPSL